MVDPVAGAVIVTLLILVAIAAPMVGVISVGEVSKTGLDVPVLIPSASKSSCAVNEPKDVALPTEVIAPVRLALVVTRPAVSPEAVPVILVPINCVGVPKVPPLVEIPAENV